MKKNIYVQFTKNAPQFAGDIRTNLFFQWVLHFRKNADTNSNLLINSKNPEIAKYSSRNIVLRDGKIREDTTNPNILNAAEALAALPAPED